jgi:hypothetical protein
MGVTALFVCIIIAFASCWQVAIVGGVLDLMLGGLQIYLGFVIQRKNEQLAKEDDAGKVGIIND